MAINYNSIFLSKALQKFNQIGNFGLKTNKHPLPRLIIHMYALVRNICMHVFKKLLTDKRLRGVVLCQLVEGTFTYINKWPEASS
jgi:hypothetical protein